MSNEHEGSRPIKSQRRIKNPRPNHLDPESLERAAKNAQQSLEARVSKAVEQKARRNRPDFLSSDVLDRVVEEHTAFFSREEDV
jgi:hypothetical protein